MATLFDISSDKAKHTGQELRDRGIEQALIHAGGEWAKEAYESLLNFLYYHNGEFMADWRKK